MRWHIHKSFRRWGSAARRQALIQVVDPAMCSSVLLQWEATWADDYEPPGEQAAATFPRKRGACCGGGRSQQPVRSVLGPRSERRFIEICANQARSCPVWQKKRDGNRCGSRKAAAHSNIQLRCSASPESHNPSVVQREASMCNVSINAQTNTEFLGSTVPDCHIDKTNDFFSFFFSKHFPVRVLVEIETRLSAQTGWK